MSYYPYLRGRMYDLLALKEACVAGELGERIVPIIEPVRDSKELLQCVETFLQYRQPFSIIANPQVSVYGLNDTKLYPLPDMEQVDYFHPAAILAPDFSSDFLQTFGQQKSFLIANNYGILKQYEHSQMMQNVAGVMIPEEARLHHIVGHKAISLTDPLTFVPHVADYAEIDDEFFQPANWYRQVDDYAGFGDYSMVGSHYFDKGMPSRAIALHVIYVTKDGSLRIHHFVSDSNDTMRNQKGKFFEALTKLVKWSDNNLHGLNRTPALEQLIAYQNQTKFPGLGMVKKLSLRYHFQLMHQLLELQMKK